MSVSRWLMVLMMLMLSVRMAMIRAPRGCVGGIVAAAGEIFAHREPLRLGRRYLPGASTSLLLRRF